MKCGSPWITVSDMPANNGTDTNTVIVLKDDPARYLNSGVATVRVTTYGSSGATGYVRAIDGYYNASFDLVRWDALEP